MWLVVSAIAALIVTGAWIHRPGKNYYGQLSIGLWTLTVMISVDHVIGWFLEGVEPFVLSLCVLIPILAVWGVMVYATNRMPIMSAVADSS